MLDSLGERYGMLPSQVLAKGNTLDLWCYDVAITYRNYKESEKSKDPNVKSQFMDSGNLEEHFKKVKNRKREDKS